jgi:hypothetical protein
MAITLNGDTGILSPDFEPSGSTVPANGMYLPTTNTLAWATNSLEQLRLDASGNLAFGFPPSAFVGQRALQPNIRSAFTGGFASTAVASNAVATDFNWNANYIGTGTYALLYKQNYLAGSHIWYNAPSGTAGNAISFTQAMTLAASGNLLVGATSALASEGFTVVRSTSANPVGAIRNGNATAGKYWIFGPNNSNNYILYNNGGTGVYVADGGTSWTASSDERLKTDLKPIENAAQKVSTLRAVTGRFKTDEESVSRSFLIAQDVLAILPEAVDTSDPEKFGVAYTDTIPLLVAAIKELTARLEALEGAK